MNATYETELYHHGIKGQKWGVRRFETLKGHLTSAGKKRYEKYKQYYKDEGMSDSEASKKAKSKQNIRRGLIIAGTIAGVAVGTKLGYEYIGKQHVDQIIKSGKEFQRVATTDADDFTRAFYATAKRGDRSKYVGMYGQQIKDAGMNAYKQTAKVTSDIKVASNKNAQKVFDEIYKNDASFRKTVDAAAANRANTIFGNDRQRAVAAKGGYKAFNLNINNHEPEMEAAKKKFYDKLKEHGYGAVHDMNDSRWSGYKAKQAVVVFDHQKVGKATISKLKDQEINAARTKALGKLTAENMLPTVGIYAGVGGAYGHAIEQERHRQAVAKNKRKGGAKSK